MQELPVLKPGDTVEVVAPASRCSPEQLSDIIKTLESWGLRCLVDQAIFGDDLLCANSDEHRFKFLKNALLRPETKAVICARGGYGSLRLIPELAKILPPDRCKLFIGMSDITALNLYLEQQWKWPVVHAALAIGKFSPESHEKLKAILFGEINEVVFQGQILNEWYKKTEETTVISAPITGGNLSLVQASIGTAWQLNAANKIVFLEEVNERGYRVDRILEHLCQANLFAGAKAIVLGDFLEGKEPDGSSLIDRVLERFAKTRCKLPVIRIEGVGHGYHSFPILFGTQATLQIKGESRQVGKLTCYRK